ncbi:MAG: hypothetical protein CSA61_01620 [Neptuniibacter caesariensis]|uniref:Lipopeptide n=1 Tax=Neptuniibacter caesariensis TaxID=207954 RepID=A0A2G6JB09_NEPCE|nr:MAG: hypothetical protein CSA61_01620 [Neptuniibacter caesariensis]
MKKQKRYAGLVIFFSLILLGGCGQKGPLYLPDSNDPAKSQQK